MVQLNDVGLVVRPGTGTGPLAIALPDARRVVASWDGAHAFETSACVAFRGGGSHTFALTHADARPPRFRRSARAGAATDPSVEAVLAVDEIRARRPIERLTLVGNAPFDRVCVAWTTRAYGSAIEGGSSPETGRAFRLGVVARSQYKSPAAGADAELEASRNGWCAPASLAMLLAFHGRDFEVERVAAGLFDPASRGTGNWAFAAAFAAKFGLGSVAYLRDLAHARAFVTAGLPLALSFAWQDRVELPGAPLPSSSGHLAVLCGFDDAGDPCFADPAQPSLVATYDYTTFERVWLAHGGVAFVVAPEREAALAIALANGFAAGRA